jgi:hypothetical protein
METTLSASGTSGKIQGGDEALLTELEPVSHAEAVTWFAERLWPREGLPRVGHFIPEGFERYARLLHPAYHHQEGEVAWSRVAEWSGRELHPMVNFEYLATREDGRHWSSEGAAGPDEELSRSLCAHLSTILAKFTSTPDRSWFCVWYGYGDIKLDQPAIEITPRISSSGRRYFLFRGPVEAVANLELPNAAQPLVARAWHGPSEDTILPPAFHSPNFWWPEDRAWFLSTEIDGPSTYIGGSEGLIARLLADTELEVLPASVDDPFEGVHPSSVSPDED